MRGTGGARGPRRRDGDRLHLTAAGRALAAEAIVAA